MMRNVSDSFHHIRQPVSTLLKLSADAWHFLVLCLRPSPALAAEVLFLRKPTGQRVAARPVVGGLHHEYELVEKAISASACAVAIRDDS
ncbi:hypothetical protein [Candidatus Entotheonella palauensis]|nr:hypothetical protein [Candidatus Entotheonella palauensis]